MNNGYLVVNMTGKKVPMKKINKFIGKYGWFMYMNIDPINPTTIGIDDIIDTVLSSGAVSDIIIFLNEDTKITSELWNFIHEKFDKRINTSFATLTRTQYAELLQCMTDERNINTCKPTIVPQAINGNKHMAWLIWLDEPKD